MPPYFAAAPLMRHSAAPCAFQPAAMPPFSFDFLSAELQLQLFDKIFIIDT